MRDRPAYRPVCKALHRPLTVCGVDRRLFFLALTMGAATFNLFYSFAAGLLMFAGLYVFALWATNRDPEMLRILLASSGFRTRYDALKHTPFDIEVRRWDSPHGRRSSSLRSCCIPGGVSDAITRPLPGFRTAAKSATSSSASSPVDT